MRDYDIVADLNEGEDFLCVYQYGRTCPADASSLVSYTIRKGMHFSGYPPKNVQLVTPKEFFE